MSCLVLSVMVFFFPAEGMGTEEDSSPPLKSLLPELNYWKITEQPAFYLPENLFEYINGAAEIYLAYDFKELAVAQYGQEESEVSVGVEIYEMSNATNAFGIYSVERFPDNNFIPIGVQGYVEEGTLNLLIGQYYVKLLCFEGGEQSEEYLRLFAKAIIEKSQGKTDFPVLIKHFPMKGMIPNSEKFMLKNVMGYSFLHDGYMANYRIDGLEFDCFIIEGKSEEEAQSMMDRYLDAKKEQPIMKIESGVSIKDKYYHNIYLSRIGNRLCGVMKIKDGQEETGLAYLKMLIDSLTQ